jgi:hypothetical protein
MRRLRRTSLALLLGTGLVLPFLVSCGGGGGGSAPLTMRSETKSVGPDGGQVAFPDEAVLTIPPGALAESTDVSLRLASRPFARSPAAKNYASGIEVELTRPVASTAEFVVTLRAPDTGGELGWTTALSAGNDLTFPAQRPRRVSATEVAIRLKGSDLHEVPVDGGGSVWRLRISPAVALSGPTPQAIARLYKSGSPDGVFRLGSDALTPVGPSESLAGKHVAIVLHGLNNQAKDAADTAYLAQEAAKQAPLGGYSAIWLFEYYDTTVGVAENGKRLADALRAHAIGQARHVDLYGHSMGGLVARWAIEKEGLGASVDRLMTFGTPHQGVPDEVLGRVLWHVLHLNGGIGDLEEHSSFIEALNATPSPYRAKVLYGTFVGKNPLYFGRFGLDVEARYRARGYLGPVDGIVAGYSAAPSNITDFGVSAPSAATILNLNHSDIGGSLKDNQFPFPNQLILPELVRMLKASVEGSIG